MRKTFEDKIKQNISEFDRQRDTLTNKLDI